MPSSVIPAIPASQLVDVVPSVLAAGGSPLQFWGLFVDANLDLNGYPMMPVGQVLLFADAEDVGSYFGFVSQEAGLANVYFTGPVNATKTPSGLLAAQYALNAVPGFLRGGNISGQTLGQIQTINAPLTVSIDGNAPITQTVNLSTATSFSNAAQLIGAQLGIHGVQKGTFQASLSSVGNVMTVSAFSSTANGPLQATCVANLSGTQMTVLQSLGGYLQVGQALQGTGITAGTTITSYSGGGQPGGVGVYTLSAAATTEIAVTISAYAATPTILVGDVVTGTGITTGTYVTGQTGGTIGGPGTYTLSQAVTTESTETIVQYAHGVGYSSTHGAFSIKSPSVGPNSSVSFASGAAASLLNLTQASGAFQSPGAAASSPSAFMSAITVQTQNWASFWTLWEPTDVDKATNPSSSFAWWNNAQGSSYRYLMWETNVVDTQPGGPSAAAAEVNNADLSGTVMIYENPAITILPGEKAAFAASWAASLDFVRRNGRQTAAFKAYVGALPDVTNGTIAETLAGSPQSGTFGFGINFYGDYTTRSQGFPEYQRGLISGPWVWDDSYTNLAIWLPNALQNSIMIGLSQAPSVPYANPGYAQIESWCLDSILAALNFGAITPGVTLSQSQITSVNQAAGIEIDQVLFNRGWYLQVLPAVAATRAVRTSPPCTLWVVDGGSIQAITLAAITVQ